MQNEYEYEAHTIKFQLLRVHGRRIHIHVNKQKECQTTSPFVARFIFNKIFLNSTSELRDSKRPWLQQGKYTGMIQTNSIF